MRRRVVITGLGVVSGFGIGAGPLWEGLCSGASNLKRLTRFNPDGFPFRLGSEVKDFSAKDYVPKSYRKAVKVMARDIELAVAAAKLAVEDSSLVTRMGIPEGDTSGATTYPSSRSGCHIGAGLIAAETDELSSAVWTARNSDPSFAEANGFDIRAWGTEGAESGKGGMNNLQPLWLLKYLPNMLACHVTILHGCEGPSNTITCNEASGLLSLGESLRVIERNAADLCFTGSAESKLNYMGVLRMHLAGLLAATGTEEDGSQLLRPYDPESKGGVVGEGGGILILEEAQCAKARGAKVYAEVAGFGAAQSIVAIGNAEGNPAPKGSERALQLAIGRAMADAGVGVADIDAIVPFGSGVIASDSSEIAALRGVFGARLEAIELVTWCTALGNTMAGNGGLAAAIGALTVKHQKFPARINAGTPAAGLRAGAAPAREGKVRNLLVCSSSLGGQSAAVILRAVS